MTRRAKVALYGNAVFIYAEDPTIPKAVLGPRGNYVRAVYDENSQRISREGAIRGYGDAGNELLERMLEIADRVAVVRNVGAVRGPMTEKVIGTVKL
ncbi:MAG: hypothetical protein H7123_06145 [Thermoleophilia bacterium]|nr:hypothetical protein [Thermoleophilia bacterium]